MATYDNDLRLKEITTGDEDGTWGTSTNTNLELIGEAFSYGVQEMAADANETFTMLDAAADDVRSFYLKITSAVSLTATREITLGPNTVSKVWMIENATSGSQIITIKQGSGATVNVPNGSKVMVVTDGAGAGAAVFNANPTEVGGTVTSVGGTGTVQGLTLSGTVTSSGNLTLGGSLADVNLATQVTGTLPVANGGTGITSFGTGVAAFLGTPTSANLAAAVTNETGSGALVFATSPTLVTPALGTPSSGTLTNATGLPIVAGTTGTLSVARGGTGQTSYTNGQLLIGNSTGNTLAKATLTAGTGVTITNGAGSVTIAATGTGGTVTSVGGTGTVNGLTLTGTVTSSGNLTLGGTLAIAATQVTSGTLSVARGGTGRSTLTSGNYLKGAGTSAIGLQSGIPAGDITSGTLADARIPNLNASKITAGTLPVARGGTGAATLTTNNVILGNGTSAVNFVAPSTSGNVLTSNGTTWTSAAPAAPAAPTTAQVLTATADASLGAVGTYAFLGNNTAMSMEPGDTQAASALRYVNADEDALASSPTPAGTWRRMGGNNGAYFPPRGTLYLRIS